MPSSRASSSSSSPCGTCARARSTTLPECDRDGALCRRRHHRARRRHVDHHARRRAAGATLVIESLLILVIGGSIVSAMVYSLFGTRTSWCALPLSASKGVVTTSGPVAARNTSTTRTPSSAAGKNDHIAVRKRCRAGLVAAGLRPQARLLQPKGCARKDRRYQRLTLSDAPPPLRAATPVAPRQAALASTVCPAAIARRASLGAGGVTPSFFDRNAPQPMGPIPQAPSLRSPQRSSTGSGRFGGFAFMSSSGRASRRRRCQPPRPPGPAAVDVPTAIPEASPDHVCIETHPPLQTHSSTGQLFSAELGGATAVSVANASNSAETQIAAAMSHPETPWEIRVHGQQPVLSLRRGFQAHGRSLLQLHQPQQMQQLRPPWQARRALLPMAVVRPQALDAVRPSHQSQYAQPPPRRPMAVARPTSLAGIPTAAAAAFPMATAILLPRQRRDLSAQDAPEDVPSWRPVTRSGQMAKRPTPTEGRRY